MLNTVLRLMCVSAILASAPAFGAVINFDDLNASAGDIVLDSLSSYQGFSWKNVSAYASTPGFPGFNNGIVSLVNAAYTTGDGLGSPFISALTRASGFDFTSAYLGSGWYNGLSVTVNGLTNGVQNFTRTVTVNTQAPQLFTFNFTGITELDIYSTVTGSTTDPYGCGPSGCSQVTLDDLNLTLLNNMPPANAPEPGTLSMLCLALVALAVVPRLRKFCRF